MLKRCTIISLLAAVLALSFPITALADVIGIPDPESIIEPVFRFFSRYFLIEAIALVCAVVVGTVVMIWLLMRRKKRR